LRLGQRVASDFFAAREGQEEFFLLFFRAKTMDRIAIQRILHGKNHAGGSANTGNFFNDDGIRYVVESRAAFGFRQGHRGQSQLRRLAKCFAREMSGLINLARQRLDFVFGELPHRALQQCLFFGESEVQP
jgi:hypothetical protein